MLPGALFVPARLHKFCTKKQLRAAEMEPGGFERPVPPIFAVNTPVYQPQNLHYNLHTTTF